MSIRKINFAGGEFFHIYNRGNSKQEIFHDKNDYFRFTKLLYLSNSSKNFKMRDLGKDVYGFNREGKLVFIGAYCLMPNHFHILITQPHNGSISNFMQKLSTGYSMYYNQKYERTGSLFEGKFKAQHANSDRYLRYLFSYIHLNPVKLINPKWKENGIKNKRMTFNFLDSYYFSSYQDYLGSNRLENKILSTSEFPAYFSKPKFFANDILDWINLQ